MSTPAAPEFLRSNVVVITGASGGIGAALAQGLGSRGTAVVLVARRADVLRAVAAINAAIVL